MQALELVFFGPGTLDLRRRPVGLPPAGHVRVATQWSLVSAGTERTCFNRSFAPGSHWDKWVRYPFRPGYSAAGVITHVGPGVEGLQVDDRVAYYGHHAQAQIIPARNCAVVPSHVDLQDAAWIGVSRTAQICVERSQISPQERVVVVGAGIIGQFVVQLASHRGANVAIVHRAPFRAAVAAAHGATHTVVAEASAAVDGVLKAFDGKLADTVIDATGNDTVLASCLKLARTFGKVVLVGDAGFPEKQHISSDLITRGLQVVGVHFDHLQDDHSNPRTPLTLANDFLSGLQSGDIRVNDLVTHRLSPQDAQLAYSGAASDALGILFDWSKV